jgi:hypothetical protein
MREGAQVLKDEAQLNSTAGEGKEINAVIPVDEEAGIYGENQSDHS